MEGEASASGDAPVRGRLSSWLCNCWRTRNKDDDRIQAELQSLLKPEEELPHVWWHQLTWRAVVVGFPLGILGTVISQKILLTTNTGGGLGGATAVLGFVIINYFIKLMGHTRLNVLSFTPQETTLMSTFANSMMAIVSSATLALDYQTYKNLGDVPGNNPEDVYEPTLNILIPFGLATSFIGFFAFISLRRLFLLKWKLPFPASAAAGMLINSLHMDTKSRVPKRQVRIMWICLLFAFSLNVFKFPFSADSITETAYNTSVDPAMDLTKLPCQGLSQFSFFGAKAAEWGWTLDFQVLFIGLGMLLDHSVNYSLLVGAIVSWGIGWPALWKRQGDWYPRGLGKTHIMGIMGYQIFIGMAVFVGDGLYHLVKSTTIAALAFRRYRAEARALREQEARQRLTMLKTRPSGVPMLPIGPTSSEGGDAAGPSQPGLTPRRGISLDGLVGGPRELGPARFAPVFPGALAHEQSEQMMPGSATALPAMTPLGAPLATPRGSDGVRMRRHTAGDSEGGPARLRAVHFDDFQVTGSGLPTHHLPVKEASLASSSSAEDPRLTAEEAERAREREALARRKAEIKAEDERKDRIDCLLFSREEFPRTFEVGGFLACVVIATVFVPMIYTQVKWYHMLVGCFLALLPAFGVAYVYGVTNQDASGIYYKAAQFLFAAWAGSQHGGVVVGLIVSQFVLMVVASPEAMIGSWKVALITRTSPWAMLLTQMLACFLNNFTFPFVFRMFANNYPLGDPNSQYKVPFANVYRSMAIVGTEGFGMLPKHCVWFMVGGLVAAIAIDGLRDLLALGAARLEAREERFRLRRLLKLTHFLIPMPMVAALAFFNMAIPSVAIDGAVGSVVKAIWMHVDPTYGLAMIPLAGAGLIAGDGIWTALANILAFSKVKPPFCVTFSNAL